jgi:hypothetical protein
MPSSQVPVFDLKYDGDKPEDSCREIIYAIFPEWKEDGDLEIKPFTQGITNSVRCQNEKELHFS